MSKYKNTVKELTALYDELDNHNKAGRYGEAFDTALLIDRALVHALESISVARKEAARKWDEQQD